MKVHVINNGRLFAYHIRKKDLKNVLKKLRKQFPKGRLIC